MSEKNKKLTRQQEEFAENYIKTGNVYQSALAAGYAESTAKKKSYQLLQNPLIAEYVERRKRELLRKNLSPEKLLETLASIVYADMGDFVKMEGAFVLPQDLSKVSPEKRRGLAGGTQWQIWARDKGGKPG